jgi:hypothetical protein
MYPDQSHQITHNEVPHLFFSNGSFMKPLASNQNLQPSAMACNHYGTFFMEVDYHQLKRVTFDSFLLQGTEDTFNTSMVPMRSPFLSAVQGQP